MALIKAKVLKKCAVGEDEFAVGDEVVVQRKAAQELLADGSLEQVGEVLDPKNEADKPLVDAYLEAHPVEEKGTTPTDESDAGTDETEQ